MTYRQRPAEKPFFIRATQLNPDYSMTYQDIGHHKWWQALHRCGAPLSFLRQDGDYDVFFILRLSHFKHLPAFDGQLNAVFIHVNGITDHHCHDLSRFTFIEEADLGYFHCVIPAKWRGSYAFYPQKHSIDAPSSDCLTERMQWIKQVLSQPYADPLNTNQLMHIPWGNKRSALVMPSAAKQRLWHESLPDTSADDKRLCPTPFCWQSKILSKQRQVWFYQSDVLRSDSQPKHALKSHQMASTFTTKGGAEQRPLVIIQDGQFWAQEMPIWRSLYLLTQQQGLPAADYVLIDSISTEQRQQDLPCNPNYWAAIFNELLPQLELHYQCRLSDRPVYTAGQSFGGLSSLFAAMTYPHKVVAALSQSGSFWWPNRAQVHDSDAQIIAKHVIAEQIENSQFHRQFRCYLDVGSFEGNMPALTKRVYQALIKKGVSCVYQTFEGGHEWLCWRESLLQALVAAMKDNRHSLPSALKEKAEKSAPEIDVQGT